MKSSIIIVCMFGIGLLSQVSHAEKKQIQEEPLPVASHDQTGPQNQEEPQNQEFFIEYQDTQGTLFQKPLGAEFFNDDDHLHTLQLKDNNICLINTPKHPRVE